MNKLVESFDYEKLENNSSNNNNNIFKVKKINRKSLQIDDSTDDSAENLQKKSNQIFVPQSLQIVNEKKFLSEKVNLKSKALLKKSLLLKNNNIQQKLQEIKVERESLEIQQNFELTPKQQLAEELINEYESNNEILPENLDIVEIAEEVEVAIESIPDIDELPISDLLITEIKSKVGYSKSKVTIKSEIASDELSQIATIVKSATDNIVIHRAMDLRTIGNTNKTQLRDSEIKLNSISYSFNPKPNSQITAKKYQRIILSVSLDYNSTKRVTLFIQESRDKYITSINMDIQFIAKLISDYFIVGFSATKAILKSNSGKNPLSLLINKYMLTRKFLVKPLYDGDDEYDHLILTTKTGKHQWLKIHIKENSLKGTYGIYCKSKLDIDWKGAKVNHKNGINIPITIEYLLQDDTIESIYKLFDTMDWSAHGMGEDDLENRQYYLMNKLTYKPLKSAFVEIYDLSSDEIDNNGVFIKDVLSKLDTSKDINSGYESEVIIGKTNYIDYFILNWSAIKIENGNSRIGKNEKNYHSREYMFTLIYSISNKKYTIQNKSFSEIKDLTGFLTKIPKAI